MARELMDDMRSGKYWECSRCGNRTPRSEKTKAEELGRCPHCINHASDDATKPQVWIAKDLATD